MSPGGLIPEPGGFTTPGVFRTFSRATRTFKACEPPPCRHLHALGLSLNLTYKAEALGPT